MTKVQAGAVAGFALTLAAIVIHQYRTNTRLKQELVKLNQQVTFDAAALPQNPAVEPEAQPVSSAVDEAELAGLREKAGALREKVRTMGVSYSSLTEKEALWKRLGGANFEIETVPGSPFVPDRYYAREMWSDVGLGSAAAAFQTALWAIRSGNAARYFEALKWREGLTPERKASVMAQVQTNGFGNHPVVGVVGLKVEAV